MSDIVTPTHQCPIVVDAGEAAPIDRPRILFARGIRWLGFAGLLATIAGLAEAGGPPINNNPTNEPRAIVNAILALDYLGPGRYTTGQEPFEYQPIFESLPPYINEGRIGNNGERNYYVKVFPSFGNCDQIMLVKAVKAAEVEFIPDTAAALDPLRNPPWQARVMVEAEVAALLVVINSRAKPLEIPCTWNDLGVGNSRTNRTDRSLTLPEDPRELASALTQFGKLHEVEYSYPGRKDIFILVNPHQQHWRFRYTLSLPSPGLASTLFLPAPGRAGKRHYDAETRGWFEAVEPRWRIEPPYQPPAIYYREYINRMRKNVEYLHNRANRACEFAIGKAAGVNQVRKADFKHPDCRPENNKEIREYRHDQAAIEGGIRFLSQIR